MYQYACNISDLADGYIFNILDLNIPTSKSYQCRNPFGRYIKRYPKGEGFIVDGRGAWFSITFLYEMTTHKHSYCQVTFHKISSIKFLDKNPDDATIEVFFINFISVLHEYENAGQTPEALDERTFH